MKKAEFTLMSIARKDGAIAAVSYVGTFAGKESTRHEYIDISKDDFPHQDLNTAFDAFSPIMKELLTQSSEQATLLGDCEISKVQSQGAGDKKWIMLTGELGCRGDLATVVNSPKIFCEMPITGQEKAMMTAWKKLQLEAYEYVINAKCSNPELDLK